MKWVKTVSEWLFSVIAYFPAIRINFLSNKCGNSRIDIYVHMSNMNVSYLFRII